MHSRIAIPRYSMFQPADWPARATSSPDAVRSRWGFGFGCYQISKAAHSFKADQLPWRHGDVFHELQVQEEPQSMALGERL